MPGAVFYAGPRQCIAEPAEAVVLRVSAGFFRGLEDPAPSAKVDLQLWHSCRDRVDKWFPRSQKLDLGHPALSQPRKEA
jgi:hypothetical protein